ncbi:scm-like with four mbt domains protein 1 [Plakobranchus ocellatus]|uniref:Scm-like with four mbt domains protein 1 n=1 Tax=Plakobranchus ocellatus TaxID=259542 RepID=A0AAV3ZG76_9GAST|nr:scm-like with four mbt domains protein 1 [Plakobranchus ocellatus]
MPVNVNSVSRSSIQAVTAGAATPVSNEANLLNSVTSGTIVSLPSGFCFSTNSNISANVSMQGADSTANGTPAPLNAMPLGPMFSVNPSQLIQPIPLSVAQQQTFTVALNQQQQFPTPTSLTMGQGPQTINVVSQPHQLVNSTIAGQSLSFVNPTLLTVSGGAGQGQYIASPFTQFPIVLGSHQGILNSINSAQPLSSQGIDPAVISQTAPACSVSVTLSQAVLPVNRTLSVLSVADTNLGKPVTQSNQIGPMPNVISTGVSLAQEPVSLSSQPVSVFSMPSPAMSVATVTKAAEVMSRQSSPDSTSPSQSIEQSGSVSLQSGLEDSPAKRVTQQEIGFVPISAASTSLGKLKREKDIESKVEPETVLSHFTMIGGCSRMKYTPVDAAQPKSNSAISMNVKDMYSTNISTTKPDREDKEKEGQPHNEKESKTDLIDGKSNERCSTPSSTVVTEHNGANQGKTGIDSIDKTEDPQGDLADVEDLEESEFVWEDYLKETGATSVPPTAFKHVEMSLQSGFSKGMKLEAPNKNNPNTYWVATIVMTCGPLLRLRYEGYDDNSSADFWSDPMTSDIHPLGWCKENGKICQPPEVIEEKYPEWNSFLTKRLVNATSAPSYLLDKSTGATPVDQICEGMRLEVQDVSRPDRLWLVKVVENIGGRLYLRYEGLDTPSHDFWLFYLHERLHPIGWSEARGYCYHPPPAVKSSLNLSEEELMKLLQATLKTITDQKLSADIFNDQSQLQPHGFQISMKLEAVNPSDCHSIGPATIVEVVDNFYFIVEMDSLQMCSSSSMDGDKIEIERLRFACHKNTPTIFPVGWAASKGIKLRPPSGYDKANFVWSEYLKSSNSEAAAEALFDLAVPDHEFECGMKLEAVNPKQPAQIGAATITQLVDHLVWVHLDGSPHLLDSHVASVLSLDLFPIGWCVSNGYQLQPPVLLRSHPSPPSLNTQTQQKKRVVAIVQPEIADSSKSGVYTQSSNNRDLFGGPQIFINHRCFSGPYLSKGRIAELPRSVGPGPLTLVMKEVLGMLINTAYKSSRVLRELQLEGKPNPDMIQQMLKAKYKGKSYRAVVEICRNANQLEEFCRHVCLKLQCCPNLISPHYIAEECPEHCDQLTKTKYTYYYGKRKRKIGRPPGGHSNLEDGQQKPGGKRRKRKRIGMLSRRSSRPAVEDQEENNEDDKESVGSDTRTADSTSTTGSKDQQDKKAATKSFAEKRGKLARERLALKRRYTHHIPPPSEIRTRGAKLPKYSFEKRTHKKIMIVEGSQQSMKPKKETVKLLHSLPMNTTGDGDQDAGNTNFSSCSSSSSSVSLRQGVLPGIPLGLGNSSASSLSLKPEPLLVLDSNPLEWSVVQVAEFLASSECGDQDLVTRLKTEEIDGQAFLLLTLPNVQEYLGIKLGPAIKLCHLIERVKVAFFHQFTT